MHQESNTLRKLPLISLISVLLLCAAGIAPAFGRDGVRGVTPPRLSLIAGEVSFWRPGAEDWAAAQLNTPLAPGDALYAASGANLEIQTGSRAFVRAAGDTELALVNQEPGYLQFRLTAGVTALDLRALPHRAMVEVDTPNAVLAIEHPGYYRVEVNDGLRFITRHGGEATISLANGERFSVPPASEVVVRGVQGARIETYTAPPPDSWDQWNEARTGQLLRSASARHLPPDVYGAEDLDRYGSWREVPDYGSVWVPAGVAPGWAPYSAGSWVWDPYYGWTWVDDSPWGWAPFHYGRWVFVGGFWAWAPGPVVVSAVYAPALVAFFDVGRRSSFAIGIGTPGLAWVALSWGEPVIPWWGGSGFIGRPWWGGWGGPRVVNNVVVRNTQIVNVTNIQFQNVRVHNAVLTAPGGEFGRERLHARPAAAGQLREMRPVRGQVPVKPDPASLVGGAPGGVRPPQSVLSRPVLTARQTVPERAGPRAQARAGVAPSTEARLVPHTGPKGKLIPGPAALQAVPERRAAPSVPGLREERARPGQPTTPPPPPGKMHERLPLKPEPVPPNAGRAPLPVERERPTRERPTRLEPAPPREGHAPPVTERERPIKIEPAPPRTVHEALPKRAPEQKALPAPRPPEPPASRELRERGPAPGAEKPRPHPPALPQATERRAPEQKAAPAPRPPEPPASRELRERGPAPPAERLRPHPPALPQAAERRAPVVKESPPPPRVREGPREEPRRPQAAPAAPVARPPEAGGGGKPPQQGGQAPPRKRRGEEPPGQDRPEPR